MKATPDPVVPTTRGHRPAPGSRPGGYPDEVANMLNLHVRTVRRHIRDRRVAREAGTDALLRRDWEATRHYQRRSELYERAVGPHQQLPESRRKRGL